MEKCFVGHIISIALIDITTGIAKTLLLSLGEQWRNFQPPGGWDFSAVAAASAAPPAAPSAPGTA